MLNIGYRISHGLIASMKTNILDTMVSLGRASQVLIFGEVHGTKEVPQFVSGMLDLLQPFGFGILGLELPHSEQAHLRNWARGEVTQPPRFFTHPFGDGRGNEQVLELVRKAANQNWVIVCFDKFDFVGGTWQERDRGMATILLNEWEQNCPEKKVICVCGNLHSRLSKGAHQDPEFWPSFAANLQLLRPELVVSSVNLVFHGGKFFNVRVRNFHGKRITEPYISEDSSNGHSIAVHLPIATPATHIGKPLSSFSQFIKVAPSVISNFMNRRKSN